MADKIELAKAYVQIIPSTEGIKGSLTDLMNGESQKAGKEAGGTLAAGIGGAMKGAGVAVAAGLGAAAVGIGVITKGAVDSYASYEQLAGGVEKLYGTASDKVMGFAQEAYRTSGMSANQYMETATSFSASLVNSLGGDVDKAAEITDVAMRAMSDNVNVFGSDFGSVQNAFQGFAKQNYTMLDNLKLGYGGTKTEMERLISDANAYRASVGLTADLSIESFADVVTAIQSVQEAQGIAGTTAKEAMGTIQGSGTTAKAAWENVVLAIGTGEGMESAMGNFVTAVFGDESGGGLLANIIPRVQIALEGVAQFLVQGAPILVAQLPAIVQQVADGFTTALPELTTGIITLVAGLVGNLPDILLPIITAIPDILTTIVGALIVNLPTLVMGVVELVAGIVLALPEIIASIWEAITSLWTEWVGPAMETVTGAFSDLWDDISAIFAVVSDWFNTNVVEPVVGFFKGLWESVAGFFSDLWNDIVSIWEVVSDWFNTNVIEPVAGFFEGLWETVAGFFSSLWDDVVAVWEAVSGWFNDYVIGPVVSFFEGLWTSVSGFFSSLWDDIVGIWEVVSDWFNDYVVEPVVGFFEGLWDGIGEAAGTAWDTVSGIWDVVSGWFQDNIITPVSDFFTGMWEGLGTGASNAWDAITGVFSVVTDWFGSTFEAAWSAVRDVFSTGGTIFMGIVEGITSAFKNVVNAIIRGINTVVAVPFNAINDALRGIRSVNILGITPFSWISTFSVPQIPELAKGGVTTGPMLATIGEDGPEAVIPLSRNTEWIQRVAERMADETNGGDMDELLALVETLAAKMDSMKIYLDGDRLVGGISGRMDKALGTHTAMSRRGVATA